MKLSSIGSVVSEIITYKYKHYLFVNPEILDLVDLTTSPLAPLSIQYFAMIILGKVRLKKSLKFTAVVRIGPCSGEKIRRKKNTY